MSLKLTDLPKAKDRVEVPALETGTYPTRIVGVVGVGKQPQEFQGEVKPPKQEIIVVYEFLDEFMKTKTGEDDETQPRWLSERFPLNSNTNERAKSTIRYTAIDPNLEYNWDFSRTVTTPVMTTVAIVAGKNQNKGRTFNKITGVSAMRPKEASKAPELVNEPFVFDFYNPDMATWEKLPDWIKGVAKSSLDFNGSKLHTFLDAGGVALKDGDSEDDRDW